MTNRDPDPLFDARIADWLEADPNVAPSATLQTVLAAAPSISQRRRLRVPRRTSRMASQLKLFGAAAAAIAVVAIGSLFFGSSRSNEPTVGAASPSIPAGSASATSSNSSSSPTTTPTGSGGPQASAWPRVTAVKGMIAFAQRPAERAAGGVFVSGADGGISRIPSDDDACCVVQSPDGTQIAIGHRVTEGFRSSDPLMITTIVDRSGSKVTDLPIFCGGCVSIVGLNYVPRAWSPDGRWIAIEAWSDGESRKTGINIAPTPANDNQYPNWSTMVTGEGRRDVPIGFSPDSTQLLYVRMLDEAGLPDGAGDLYVTTIARDGTAIGARRLNPDGTVVLRTDLFGAGASWAPDGKRVAFTAMPRIGADRRAPVYVVAVAGGAATPITGGGLWATSARWSPDGAWIAFDQAGAGGAHDVWLVRPDGTDGRRIASLPGGLCCAEWSPDSTSLLVQGTTGVPDPSGLSGGLLIVAADGSRIETLVNGVARYESYSWR